MDYAAQKSSHYARVWGLNGMQEAELNWLIHEAMREQRNASHDAINRLEGARCDLHGSVEVRCVPAISAAHAAVSAEPEPDAAEA